MKKGLIGAILLLSVFASAFAMIGTASACGERLGTMVVTSGTKDQVKMLDGHWYKRAVATWVHSYWPTIEGAAWISTSYYVEDPVSESWRQFKRTFCIPGHVVSASINITADDAYQLYVNGKLVGSACSYWDTEKYDVTSVLRCGQNSINVVVQNGAADGSTWDNNPTGLIYRIDITYRVYW
jgi:hypothetical protein